MNQLHHEVGKLNHKKDSLTKLNLPTASVTHEIDSVERAQKKKMNELNSKIENAKKETLSKISSLHLPPEAQSEVSALTKNINGFSVPSNFFKVPSVNLSLGNSAVPGVPNMPSLNLPNNNLSIPTTNIPSVQKIGLNTKIPVPSLSQLQGSLAKDSKELQSLKNKANADAVEKDAENVAKQNGEVKSLTQEEQKLKGLKKELSNVNPKNADSLAMQQLKPAVNHFLGKEKELQSAMGEVSKLKQKYSSVKSMAELPKRAPNPLKGKPWYERVVPGLNYFVMGRHYTMVDLNPYLGWRFTPKLTASLGWNERIGVSKGSVFTHRYDRIYGVRSSVTYAWTHGIVFKIAPEVMDAFVPVASPDLKQEKLVFGVYAGVRKDFPIYKNISGYSEVLYNFTQKPGQNIYGDPVTFRFGLEVKLKKNVKK